MPLQSSGLHLHGTLWMCFVTKGDPINLFLCLGQGISSPCSHTNCYFQRWRIHQELQSQRTGELSETVKQLQAPSPSPHTDPGRAIPNGKGIAWDPWVVVEGDFYWVELRQESAKESWTGLQEFFIQTLKKVLSFGQVFWARLFPPWTYHFCHPWGMCFETRTLGIWSCGAQLAKTLQEEIVGWKDKITPWGLIQEHNFLPTCLPPQHPCIAIAWGYLRQFAPSLQSLSDLWSMKIPTLSLQAAKSYEI